MKHLIMVAGVALLAGCGEMPEEEAAAAAGPPVEVASTELARAFADNEVAAQQAYGGKTLVVSGQVQSIELDFMDEPVVMLPGTDDFTNVHVSFGDDNAGAAAQLSKGQEITVRCTELSEVMGSPMLDGCVLDS